MPTQDGKSIYDKRRMQDIKLCEKDLWQKYTTFWANNNMIDLMKLLSENPNLKYKTINAYNWNRVVKLINDSLSVDLSKSSNSSIFAKYTFDNFNQLQIYTYLPIGVLPPEPLFGVVSFIVECSKNCDMTFSYDSIVDQIEGVEKVATITGVDDKSLIQTITKQSNITTFNTGNNSSISININAPSDSSSEENIRTISGLQLDLGNKKLENPQYATYDSLVGKWNIDYGTLLVSSKNFKYVGIWSSGNDYKKNNLARLNNMNESYFCIKDHISSDATKPPNSEFWILAEYSNKSVGIQVSESTPINLRNNDIFFQIKK